MKKQPPQHQTEKKSKATRLKPGLPRRVLVFETTGFGLYGKVAASHVDGTVQGSEPAYSNASEFAVAVGEVLEQLAEQTKKRLPKTAVLISPSAASELVPLPVDPRKPRPRLQMNELVRWELEEVSVRQNDIWSLGALLQGRGYVTAEQRRELEVHAESEGGHVSAVNTYRNAVSQDQFDECLGLQEILMSMDDELALGWSPQQGAPEEGQFAWYCAGAAEGVCAEWVKAFKTHEIFCSLIYPQLGAAFPLVEFGPDQTMRLLVDIRQEQFGLFQGVDGRLDALSIHSCVKGAVDPQQIASAVQRFMPEETTGIYLSAPEADHATVAAALEHQLDGVEILSVPGLEPTEKKIPPAILASLEGVARHALKKSRLGGLVGVLVQPPRPPIWKSKTFWPWAVIVGLLVALISTEISVRLRTLQRNAELVDLEIEYELRMQIKSEASATRGDVRALDKELTEKEQEHTELMRRMEVLEDVIRYRQHLVPGVLQAIGVAIPPEVQLDSIQENEDRNGFYLEGWALRDTEAQRFGNLLNEKLAPWNYSLADLRLARGKGRLGLEGFVVKIRLVKTELQQEDES